ncbi:MAG: ACT domain-containing protein [Acidimicrobiales bacterium]
MSGETDLATMLASLDVVARPDPYTLVQLRADGPLPALGDGVAGVVAEDEGVTVFATIARAEAENWPVGFVAAWLTLSIHSALEAVGLTAAVSAALAEVDISCNVVAAHHHDHLLVPWDRADDARAALATLAASDQA